MLMLHISLFAIMKIDLMKVSTWRFYLLFSCLEMTPHLRQEAKNISFLTLNGGPINVI